MRDRYFSTVVDETVQKYDSDSVARLQRATRQWSLLDFASVIAGRERMNLCHICQLMVGQRI